MEYDYVDKNRERRPHLLHQRPAKMRAHYPEWDITKSLKDIFNEIHQSWNARLAAAAQ